jgi:ribonuclease VapC
VIAVDSSALIAILRLEPDSAHLLRALVAAEGRVLSALNLLETSMVLAGQGGGASLWQPLDDFLEEARVEIAPFDAGQAQHARDAFVRYGKGRHPAALNLGDCAAYALAASRKLPLLFKGEDFRKTDVMAVL